MIYQFQYRYAGKNMAPVRDTWRSAAQDAVADGKATWEGAELKLANLAEIARVPKVPA